MVRTGSCSCRLSANTDGLIQRHARVISAHSKEQEYIKFPVRAWRTLVYVIVVQAILDDRLIRRCKGRCNRTREQSQSPASFEVILGKSVPSQHVGDVRGEGCLDPRFLHVV